MSKETEPIEEITEPDQIGSDIQASVKQSTANTESTLAPEDKFREMIDALRKQSTITNDRHEQIPFEDEVKKDFINAFEDGYPIIGKTFLSLYELGNFLHGVRKKLKVHKLYHTWLEYAGIPRQTAQNYVQAYDRYLDKLPRFATLGIKKLLIASRLPDCAQYVEKHEDEIARQSAEELQAKVKKLSKKKVGTPKPGGRKPSYIDVGSCRIRPSTDGSRIIVEGLPKGMQKEVIEAIKDVLSSEEE